MKTKSKLLLAVTLLLLALGVANLINIFLNFRSTTISHAVEKSKMAANIVKNGLTAHMVNGIMDKREYFLRQISTNDEIKSLWIVRGKNVTKQYGEGLAGESTKDAIDKNVLKTGKMQKQLIEDINKMIWKIRKLSN